MERITEVMIDRNEIAEAVERLGRQISEDYKDREIVVIGNMFKGSIIFCFKLADDIVGGAAGEHQRL